MYRTALFQGPQYATAVRITVNLCPSLRPKLEWHKVVYIQNINVCIGLFVAGFPLHIYTQPVVPFMHYMPWAVHPTANMYEYILIPKYMFTWVQTYTKSYYNNLLNILCKYGIILMENI